MNATQVKNLLKKAWPAKISVLLRGKPGIGKTEVIKETAKEMGFDLIMFHPAISEPVDFKGYPMAYERNGRRICDFLPDSHLEKLIIATEPTVADVEDVGQSPASVQAALMQLIQERRINGHRLSEHVVFAGTTNDTTHMAGVMGFIEPFKGRWGTIVELEAGLEDWCAWANGANMPPILIAFLRTRPGLLHDFKPSKTLERSPDPRSWEKVGRWINLGINDLDVHEGCVGKGAASELQKFILLAENAPSLDNIIANPETAPVPDHPSMQHLVVSGLARRADKGNIERVAKYLERMSQAMRVLCWRDTLKINPQLQQTKPGILFVTNELASFSL